jgi:hypothetical protein
MLSEERLKETALSLMQEHGVRTLGELPTPVQQHFEGQCREVVASRPPPVLLRIWNRLMDGGIADG